MVQEEIRKGPWTEQEDLQLVCFVGLFGDRRWDFIAKVSGLKRTGKSCRLRWVNYLHPDLKRGKMTPHEEKLVIELHSQWGNRWSRIARRLPGRTDNEIKNYWRTHMRKKAQENKRAASNSSSNSSSSSTSYSSLSNDPAVNSVADVALPLQGTLQQKDDHNDEKGVHYYSMDDIWKDITSEEEPIKPVYDCYNECSSNFSCSPIASQLWDNCPDTLWKFDGERDSKVFFPNDQFLPCYEDGYVSLID